MRIRKEILALLTAVPLVLSVTVAAQKRESPDVLLRIAADKAAIDGDLNAAITQYQAIVDKYSKTDRRAAATALVQMADCYHKLGDVNARKIYERVVRDYSDQRDKVALARERLGSLDSSRGGLLTQRVWIPEAMEFSLGGRVSPDGRRTLFSDWKTNDLSVRDLTTGTVHRVTLDGSSDPDAEAYPGVSTFSPDGSQIAYGWYLDKTATCVLRLSPSEGSAPPQTLYANPEIISIDPFDWSADGKLIAVALKRRDHTAQIAVVKVRDGSLVVLKSVDWSGVGGLRFSPDSQSIAYHRPAREGGFERDVFVISVDGSREITAVNSPSDDIMLEWTRDGKRLLIGSDRGGAMGLWATRVDGGAQNLELLKADLGDIDSAGLTRNGTLYYRVQPARAEIYVASFDQATGQLTSKPEPAIQQFRGLNMQPEWSSDGRSLMYASRREISAVARPIFVIQSLENGSRRELHPPLSYGGYARWSPDGRQLLVRGADLKGRSGILTVNATTEETKLVAPEDVCSGIPFWGLAGANFFCFDFRKRQIVEVDAISGAVQRTFSTDGQGWGVSPDGRFLLYGSELPIQKGLRLIELSDGTSRDLIKLTPPASRVHNWGTVTWTADSRAVAFFGTLNGDTGLWYVPVDGTPHRLNVDARSMGMVRFNSKTGQMVFATDSGPRVELWKIENFLPVATAIRSSR